jgi:hypothetical protein
MVLTWMMMPRIGGREVLEAVRIVSDAFERNLTAWEADNATFTGVKARKAKKVAKAATPAKATKATATGKKAGAKKPTKAAGTAGRTAARKKGA